MCCRSRQILVPCMSRDLRRRLRLTAAINWTDINGAYAESTADPDFFDEAPFVGAVNPDGSDPWWAGWTINGSL